MDTYKGLLIKKTENGFRITRDDGSDIHTHVKNRSTCYKMIDYVTSNKIPTRVENYYLESCIRLSSNENYIIKIQELLHVREQKGRKQRFYNPHIKKSF